jgi:hypothetical protein
LVTDAYHRLQGYRMLASHYREYPLKPLDQHGELNPLFTDSMMSGGMSGYANASPASPYY